MSTMYPRTKQERIASLKREIEYGHKDAADAEVMAQRETQPGHMTAEQWATEAARFRRRTKALEGMLALLLQENNDE